VAVTFLFCKQQQGLLTTLKFRA